MLWGCQAENSSVTPSPPSPPASNPVPTVAWPTATPRPLYVGSPSFALQNLPVTHTMGPDGYNWAQSWSILLTTGHANPDFNSKVIMLAEDDISDHYFVFSNDGGVTWGQSSLKQPYLTRGAIAYDSINDKLHVLWATSQSNGGIIYRRYSIVRDANGNITDITRPEENINLVIDDTGAGMQYEFPTILFLKDPVVQGKPNPNGALLAVWSCLNTTDNPGWEIRAIMHVLSNDANDGNGQGWTDLGQSSSSTIANPPLTASYTTFASGTTGVGAPPHIAFHRKITGSHAKDLYIFWYNVDNNSYFYKRLPWNANSTNWNNPFSATTLVSPVVRAGTDTGYSGKNQLSTKPVEDKAKDLVYYGFANWKDNTKGDTWSFIYIDGADKVSNIADVYSANGPHSFAPTGDIVFDQASNRLIASYTHTNTQYVYIQVFDGLNQAQPETAMFTTAAVDGAGFWSDPLTSEARANVNGGDKLISVFKTNNELPFKPTAQLSAALTSPDESEIKVVSAEGYPSAGNYYITVDNEKMLVTGGQGTTTWQVVRAQLGTSAAPHSAGASVKFKSGYAGTMTLAPVAKPTG